MRRPRIPATIAAIVALALTACGSSDEGTNRAFDPEHVHGLAQAPDGRLLIATHEGLFALEEGGEPTPVGEFATDLMGFTLDESGSFYASGHPGPGEDGPSALGLIKSSDDGDSFQELSLGGQADFHSLEAIAGAVYGVNGGTQLLRSTDDGANWDEFALPQPVADIAVDPTTETILVTSEAGLLRSEDLGETFSMDQDAPTLFLVDWSSNGTLMGVDLSGQIFTMREDHGWVRGASLDQPQALTVNADGVAYVATENALLSSTDGGLSFTTLTRW